MLKFRESHYLSCYVWKIIINSVTPRKTLEGSFFFLYSRAQVCITQEASDARGSSFIKKKPHSRVLFQEKGGTFSGPRYSLLHRVNSHVGGPQKPKSASLNQYFIIIRASQQKYLSSMNTSFCLNCSRMFRHVNRSIPYAINHCEAIGPSTSARSK